MLYYPLKYDRIRMSGSIRCTIRGRGEIAFADEVLCGFNGPKN